MEKVVIVGSNGFLGSILAKDLSTVFEVVQVFRGSELGIDLENLENIDQLVQYLEKNHVKYFINCAAISDVEKCAVDPEKSYRVNVVNTIKLLDLGLKYCDKVIHFSTDYVYTPLKEFRLLLEDDERVPETIYGKHKKEVEDYLLSLSCSNWIVFRVGKLVSAKKNLRNFLWQMIDTLRKDGVVKVFVDQVITPTYIEDIIELLLNKMFIELSGVFNVASDEVYSRFELAQKIKALVGSGSVEKILMESVVTLENRPRFNTLSNFRIKQVIDFNPRKAVVVIQDLLR